MYKMEPYYNTRLIIHVNPRFKGMDDYEVSIDEKTYKYTTDPERLKELEDREAKRKELAKEGTKVAKPIVKEVGKLLKELEKIHEKYGIVIDLKEVTGNNFYYTENSGWDSSYC